MFVVIINANERPLRPSSFNWRGVSSALFHSSYSTSFDNRSASSMTCPIILNPALVPSKHIRFWKLQQLQLETYPESISQSQPRFKHKQGQIALRMILCIRLCHHEVVFSARHRQCVSITSGSLSMKLVRLTRGSFSHLAEFFFFL